MNPVQTIRQAAQASLRALTRPDTEPAGDAEARQPWWRRLWAFKRARYTAIALVLIAGVVSFMAARPPLVEAAVATRGEAVDIVYATGVIEYTRQASIAPIVTAPIQRVLAEEGQRVRQGALLAQLEDGPQRGTALQLEAQASTARLAAQRTQTLYARGYASQAAWDEARGQRDAAAAAAGSARARLADYAITAPFSGTVLRRDAEPGDLATPSRVLFVIANTSELRVDAELDERDIARIEEGQPALIRADAFDGQAFNASVTEITPQGDAATRVFRARLAIEPGTPLRAGMTVEANIVSARRENAVLAPSSAVRNDAVWVLEDGRARRRAVVTGARGERMTEIRQGLQEGERVVLDPPEGFGDNARVRVLEQGAD